MIKFALLSFGTFVDTVTVSALAGAGVWAIAVLILSLERIS
ncbi:MAG TPA: hypothetical protein VN929_01735 [Burkholderiales bacterium]|nr:hypothetical protein [Burkholderiales bacterium]